MNKYLLLAIMCIIMASCNPCERLSKRCPAAITMPDSVWVHDSVWVERWRVDTVVRVRLERETVRETVPLTDTARAETAYACAVSYAVGQRIVLDLANKDSVEMLLSAYHELRNAYREKRSNRNEVQVQTVYKCRPIIQTGAWIGLAAIIYILVRIILFLRSKLL